MSRETLGRWLAGKTEYIPQKRAEKLAEVLNCPPYYICPELQDSNIASSRKPSKKVPIESMIKAAIFSDTWSDIQILLNQGSSTEFVEDYRINIHLFNSLQEVFELRIDAKRSEEQGINREYELFDLLAKLNLGSGLSKIMRGDFQEGYHLCETTTIQSRTDWVLSLAFLASTISSILLENLELARTTIDESIDVIGESKDTLGLFFMGNLYLIQSFILAKHQNEKSEEALESGRKCFKEIGYLLGNIRYQYYQCYLSSCKPNGNVNYSLLRDVAKITSRLPPVFKLEILYLCMRTAKNIEDQQLYLNFQKIVQNLAPGFLKAKVA